MNNLIEEQYNIIQTKAFITKADLKILMGFADADCKQMLQDVYHDIRKKYLTDCKGLNKIPPARYVIPLQYALDYLKDYGITTKKIIKNYRLEMSMKGDKTKWN